MLPENSTSKLQHDGKIIIATGSNRKETCWKTGEWQWSELVAKFSETIRTPETFNEFKRLSKDRQSEIKDVGGFVKCGLKEGRRKKENAAWGSLVVIDIDYATPNMWDNLTLLFDCAMCMYTTHSHSPEKPRLRLVIPLKQSLSPDKAKYVSYKLAAEIGSQYIDSTTHDTARLMFWPSTSSDGEFFCKVQDAPFFDTDPLFAANPDWQDISTWPESDRAKKEQLKQLTKQEDPLKKTGIIGAFCRTYSISEAINTFLSDIYEPYIDQTRYTYSKGSTAAGLVLYDDKFAFSHHGTDPASGILCNAFDLVRIHKFGDRDDEMTENTPPAKYPSFMAMQDLARGDEKVKLTLGEENAQRIKDAFVDNPVTESGEAENPNAWMTKLDYNKSGKLENTPINWYNLVLNDPNLKGIAFNEHRQDLEVVAKLPWRGAGSWKNVDFDYCYFYVNQVYGLDSMAKCRSALACVGDKRSYHPVKQYLNNLPEWDGIPRLNTLLIEYLGAEDNEYTKEVTRKTLIAAVARIFQPGIKFDYMLVLVGGQGIGKSTLFRKLCVNDSWFTDSLSMDDMRDKAGAEKIQGCWIAEVSELAGMRKTDIETVKSFISRQYERYRAAYAHKAEDLPRQCILVGTTNAELGFLRDITGGRRFWPVNTYKVADKATWEITQSEIDQIWAEALAAYRNHETLNLPQHVAEMASVEQKKALEADDREGMLSEYLNRPLPTNWPTMTLSERRAYIHGNNTTAEGTVQRTRVCVMEIWCELFNKEPGAIKKPDMHDIHWLLRKVEGWDSYTASKSGKAYFTLYGSQRAYVRTGDIIDA